ncbi:hypothetical protein [uncultured Ramlibacter sp.]|uniref:hypothetical protein n=1 Tax=uncultured Ramlibacter sp. TaxID=260755 RepID=UPI00262F7C26|nr:hypothetical protein [uncultured Ramlibacter sp.]
MGIALFTFNGLFAPLQGLAAWLAGAALPQAAPRQCRRAANLIASQAHSTGATGHNCAHKALTRPLRVLRVLDEGQPRAGAGRMVISGRMADVCAELDRLAALEAAAG